MPSKSRLHAQVQRQRPGKLLDIGCGNARSWSKWRKHECWGIDASAQMLQAAPKEFQERLRQANAEDLPFPDAAFDVVIMAHVLSTSSQPIYILNEAYRILKPGGVLLIQNHDSLNWRFTDTLFSPFARLLNVNLPFFLMDSITESPFQLVESENLGRLSYFKLITLRKP